LNGPAAAAAAKPSAHVLGLRIDALDDASILGRALALMKGSAPALMVTANALLALEAEKDAALSRACRSAELVTPDGIGLVWAAWRLKQAPLERLPGIDLAFSLCSLAAASGMPVFLLGGAPGVAGEAASFLREHIAGIRIAGVHDGFFPAARDGDVVRLIRDGGARLVLVALGMPRQELWIDGHRPDLPPGLYVGVGGSFDVWSGRLRRAPALVQRLGLEWLFRLLQEPSRYGRMIQLPVFAWRVERARRRAISPRS
jgi:N-acetylglucosaminyldiphosphoundecaprenol N-acetyl-beta-D-mannosaminyltransferase